MMGLSTYVVDGVRIVPQDHTTDSSSKLFDWTLGGLRLAGWKKLFACYRSGVASYLKTPGTSS